MWCGGDCTRGVVVRLGQVVVLAGGESGWDGDSGRCVVMRRDVNGSFSRCVVVALGEVMV